MDAHSRDIIKSPCFVGRNRSPDHKPRILGLWENQASHDTGDRATAIALRHGTCSLFNTELISIYSFVCSDSTQPDKCDILLLGDQDFTHFHLHMVLTPNSTHHNPAPPPSSPLSRHRPGNMNLLFFYSAESCIQRCGM